MAIENLMSSIFLSDLLSQRSKLAVDDPTNTELIDEHAEFLRPESWAVRHGDRAAFSQCIEDRLGFVDAVIVQRDIDTLDTFIGPSGRSIAAYSNPPPGSSNWAFITRSAQAGSI